MTIFHYDNYRDYLKTYIHSQPLQGRGELARMAQSLKVHSTLMSLILSGKRDLNQEQAFDLCEYLQLSEGEREYFLLLLQLQRAGTERLRSYLKTKVDSLKKENQKLSHRVKDSTILKDADKAVFYSSWIFSAIRMYCSTNTKGRTIEEISSRFIVPRNKVVEMVQFMSQKGLLIEKSNRYSLGAQKTYVPFGSPFLTRHHLNWRIKSLQKADHLTAEELMITAPLSISKKDFAILREWMLEFVEKASTLVKDSDPDDIACLNLDLYWID